MGSIATSRADESDNWGVHPIAREIQASMLKMI